MHRIGYKKSSTHLSEIGVSQTDRFQHTYVVGQTGTGKSTFAKDSFMQDVFAGFGAAYFDFHGQDAPWLLEHIPTDRIDDVVYFNPLDTEFAIGYNVLDGVRPDDYSTFTDEIVASLRHIHSASWGARMDDILTNAIRPLFDLPPESKGTLLGAVRILSDPYYRNWAVGQCTEKTVRDFWFSEYAGWSKNDRAHNLNSSLNKLRRFQSSPILRRVLGQQKSRISFARSISDGQLLIFDFNKWHMGAVNASTLASLVLSRLIYEGTRRPALSTAGQGTTPLLLRPFHIVVDEFQSITSLSTVEALSGIRKYRVGFTLCHQYTDQLPEEVFSSIKGNVGTKVCFRVGGDDALRLQRSFEVSDPKHLSSLDDYEFFAQFKHSNSVVTKNGFTLPLDWQRYGHGQAIRNRMRAKFAVPVAKVEEQYERWVSSRHFHKRLR